MTFSDRNHIPVDHNAFPADLVNEDRGEFDRKHNANPPSKEEEVYRSLAGYIHNELPMHKFKRDHIWDDPRIDRLLVETLKHQITGKRADLSAIGEGWLQIVSEAFRDYVSMQPEDE